MKRTFDIVASCSGFLLLSPVLLLLVLLVRINLGSPIFFQHQRPGMGGKPFTLYKFRSMTNRRGPDGVLLPDEDRLTPFGQFLRSSSLDELPELINVIKGDMSLVGPRPLLMEYLGRYSPEQARRHEVRPGLTGWAQVNGRNALSWDRKFELDVWYVDNRSFWLDLKILWMTLVKVVRREGISADGHASAPFFTGNKQVNHKNDEAG